MKSGVQKGLILLILFVLSTGAISQVRIKDVSNLAGYEEMRLIGYGLVVGLDRTGDSPKSLFTNQSLVNMLERFGIAVDSDGVRSRNVAAVIVTGDVPPFSHAGARFDVTASSLGDSKSLHGGVLLQTVMTDITGEPWAIAAGPLAIGGFSIETEQMKVRENHPVVGRIPDGGRLKREPEMALQDTTELTFLLSSSDFTTSRNMADAINQAFESAIAIPVDSRSVQITVPDTFAISSKIVDFISNVELVKFFPDVAAKVVINERTGTIVIGENVNLAPAAISHGSLSITIKTTPVVSQAQPFAPGGETVRDQLQEVMVEQRDTGVVALPGATTVGDVAGALNRLGVNPRDIIAIFQALKQAGALHAELVII